ncbi:hypothetical protein BJ875DRAFT_369891 [Amylocarpus encephaloides]|uniref:Uncharacterized protein n=1 Tax=Amylocarpus encephaloides TaxID=45428 RepID=A0A9P7YPN7_9HELO|nr:hypothetical protein BJ875DRAFT_369891 [Amylocarpus encephaloides]
MEQWLADGEPAHPWDGGKWDPVNDQNQGVLSSGSFEKKPVTRRTTKKGKKGRGKVAKRDVNKEFEVYFGDECKLVNWQRLACDLGLEGNFSSITQCRKAFRNVWVNIVDFMDALYARNTSNASKFLTSDAMDALNIEKWHVDSTGSSHVNINALNVIMSALNVNANNQLVSMGPVDVKKFCSQKSLGKYTRKTKKFYPLNKAKKEGPIRALLAHIR